MPQSIICKNETKSYVHRFHKHTLTAVLFPDTEIIQIEAFSTPRGIGVEIESVGHNPVIVWHASGGFIRVYRDTVKSWTVIRHPLSHQDMEPWTFSKAISQHFCKIRAISVSTNYSLIPFSPIVMDFGIFKYSDRTCHKILLAILTVIFV